MNDNVVKELGDIRSFLERKYHPYPASCCDYAADLVARVTGLSAKAGYFNISPHSKTCFIHKQVRGWRRHCWNYDAVDKLIIDLSVDQFDFINTKVLIAPIDSSIGMRYESSLFTKFASLYLFRGKRPYLAEAYKEFRSGSDVNMVFDGPRIPVAEL